MASNEHRAVAERWRVRRVRGAISRRATRGTAPARRATRRRSSPSSTTSSPELGQLQHRLWAEGRRSLLVVLQAMDAGGKDGTIRKVFTGVNPQGVTVTSFKAPTARGAGARLPVAHPPPHARCGRDRHLQPLALRGRADRPGGRAGARGGVAAALRDHPQLRGVAGRGGHAGREALPPHLARGAEGAVPGPARRPHQAVEVLGRRPRGARALARLPGRPTPRRWPRPPPTRARGTWCPPIASGSATGRCCRCCSPTSRRWTRSSPPRSPGSTPSPSPTSDRRTAVSSDGQVGMRTANRHPAGRRFSARMVPPCSSTIQRAMARPRPEPPSSVLRASSVR
jgi:hypothetical protein